MQKTAVPTAGNDWGTAPAAGFVRTLDAREVLP